MIPLEQAWKQWTPEGGDARASETVDRIEVKRICGGQNMAAATMHSERLDMDLPVYVEFWLQEGKAYSFSMRSVTVPCMTLPLSADLARSADAQIDLIRTKARETLL